MNAPVEDFGVLNRPDVHSPPHGGTLIEGQKAAQLD
jgi:hypothetical protein